MNTEPVLTYECHVTESVHAVPGPDARILKIGDGGFVVACSCGPEPLEDVDEPPHPSTDHLVNIYADDPTPEQWLRLDDAADGWSDTTAEETPDDDRYEGTHGQRREDFRSQVEEIADDYTPRAASNREKQVRNVECPSCGAGVSQKCQRPSGHRVRTPHTDRVDAAVDAGVIEAESAHETGIFTEQAALGDW